MSAIAQEAAKMELLLQYGIVTGDEILKWADSMIVQMQTPPEALIELSTTSPSKTEDIISWLAQLSSGADFWSALRSALPQIRDYVSTHREKAASIANHLFHTACIFDVSSVPKDLCFIYRYDDAFALASDGTYGSLETAYKEFVDELDKASGSNSAA